MIRLNLTNIPGLQEEEIAPQFDLEGLVLEQPVQEEAEAPAAEEVEAVKPRPSETPPAAPEVPEVDEDLFKLAEANLDLIEQAEKEEFGPIDEEQAKKLEKGEAVKQRSIRPVLRYTFYLILVAAIVYGVWAYRQGMFSKKEIKQVASRTEQTITDEADKILDKTVDIVDDLVEKEESLVPETVQPPTAQPPARREPIQPIERYYGASQISDDFIYRVYQGQQRLQVCADVLASFPSNSQLQYIRVKDDKVSFILYVADEVQAQQIKSSILSNNRFLPPEVYFVERSNKFANNPVEIMAIVKFGIPPCEDQKGYKYFNDLQLSQHIWQAGLNSSVSMEPLQISSRDNTVARQAGLTGTGSTNNVIQFLSGLGTIRDNMEVSVISITNTLNKSILETQLNYNLNTILYPAKL
jgi:hypothetical protein